MNIYLICPVRNVTEEQTNEIEEYVKKQESLGHQVHYPPRDVNQNCETGVNIVKSHREAMINSDLVAVYWDVSSKGSHFDLGMAMALSKPIEPIKCIPKDPDGLKSYWKVMNRYKEVYS